MGCRNTGGPSWTRRRISGGRKEAKIQCWGKYYCVSFSDVSMRLQGFDPSYGHDDTSNNAGYHHKNDYQDSAQDDRHRGGGFNKKRLIPSEPSPHVIFLGLDPDFTEADVCFPSQTLYSIAHNFSATSIPHITIM